MIERLQKIRDRSTLNLQVIPQTGYYEIFFDSEAGDAVPRIEHWRGDDLPVQPAPVCSAGVTR